MNHFLSPHPNVIERNCLKKKSRKIKKILNIFNFHTQKTYDMLSAVNRASVM